MTDQAQIAGIGHNLPPPVDAEARFDELHVRLNDVILNANRWAIECPTIEIEEHAEAAGDFLDQLRKLHNDKSKKGQLTDARMAEQEKPTKEIDAIRDRYAPLTRAVELASKLIRQKLDVWLEKKDAAKKAEDRRLAAEAIQKREAAEVAAAEAEHGEGDVIGNAMRAEEAQQAAEAAEKHAERHAKARVGVASAYGGRTKTLRSRTVVIIEDATKIPAKHLKRLCAHDYVTEALCRAVKADLNAFANVPGITIEKRRSVA